MNKQTFFNLIDKYQDGTATAPEKALIEEYYRSLEAMGKTALSSEEELEVKERMYPQIIASSIELEKGATTVEFQSTDSLRRIHFRRSRWWAAAAIIIMLGAGSYFLFFNNGRKQDEIVTTGATKDVEAPKNTKAMITLANGKQVFLDSLTSGQLAMQDNIKLVKLANGQIAYQTTNGEVLTELKYNTLDNPKGSTVVDMTLADGSRVWLNAGSSVTFPIAFIGNERKVSITGEAYFEVAYNSSMPFKVNKDKMEVTVLGTHFNIKAYDDESDIKVTLLEGSVRVSIGNANGILKPGEQAKVTNDVTIANDVNLDEVMAWKNGFFQFNRASLQEVLRQLTRWYDVDVVYEGKIPERQFLGEMERDLNLSQVLKILEKNKVHFKIEGKKIIVMP